MAKKRIAKSKAKVAKVKKAPIAPLQQMETRYFEELVQLSNTYAQLRKQHAQYEYGLKQLTDKRKQIQTGAITPPIMMALGTNSFYMEDSKKRILSDMDKQIDTIKNSLRGIAGQLNHRADDYIESGLRLKAFAEHRFGQYKMKKIAPERKDHKEEKEIFAADFEKLLKDPAIQKEFKKQKAEAIKANNTQKE